MSSQCRDLLTDARLLLEAGQAPRAHALATLAFEETGKAFICILALLPGPELFFGSRGDDFWAAWNSHTDKLTWARGFLALLMSDPAGPTQEAAMRVINAAGAGHLRKMRGLYVDYLAGTVLLSENLTTEEARELTADVHSGGMSTSCWGMACDMRQLRMRQRGGCAACLCLPAPSVRCGVRCPFRLPTCG